MKIFNNHSTNNLKQEINPHQFKPYKVATQSLRDFLLAKKMKISFAEY